MGRQVEVDLHSLRHRIDTRQRVHLSERRRRTNRKNSIFQGELIELDAAKHTFTVRNGNKELVFAIDPPRCDITVDGSIIRRSLKFARIGDAVMGKLSLKEAKPYVAWVEFTHKPQVGKAITMRMYSFSV